MGSRHAMYHSTLVYVSLACLLAVLPAVAPAAFDEYTGFVQTIEIDFSGASATWVSQVDFDSLECSMGIDANYCGGEASGLVFQPLGTCTQRVMQLVPRVDMRQVRSFLLDDIRIPNYPSGYIDVVWPTCGTASENGFDDALEVRLSHDDPADAQEYVSWHFDMLYAPEDNNAVLRQTWFINEYPAVDGFGMDEAEIGTLSGDDWFDQVTSWAFQISQDQEGENISVAVIERIRLGGHYLNSFKHAESYQALVPLVLPGYTMFWVNSFELGNDQHVIQSTPAPNGLYQNHHQNYLVYDTSSPDCASNFHAGFFDAYNTDNDGLVLSFDNLPPHTSVQITLDLLLFGEWKGEQENERVVWYVDDQLAFETTIAASLDGAALSNTMCFPDAAGCANPGPGNAGMIKVVGVGSGCEYYNAGLDHNLVSAFSITVPHTAASLRVNVTHRLAMYSDGSLSLDNVAIALKRVDQRPSLLWLWVSLAAVGVVAVGAAAAFAIIGQSRRSTASAHPLTRKQKNLHGGSTASLSSATSNASIGSATSSTPSLVRGASTRAVVPSRKHKSKSHTPKRMRVAQGGGSQRSMVAVVPPGALAEDMRSVATSATSGSGVSRYGIADDYGAGPSAATNHSLTRMERHAHAQAMPPAQSPP